MTFRIGRLAVIGAIFVSGLGVVASPAISVEIGAISGTVTVGGVPTGGVEVVVERTGESPVGGDGPATTAADGTYTIGDLPDGDYVVQFSLSEYLGEWYDNSYTRDGATLVSIVGGAPVSGIDANLTQGGSISGRVGDDHSGLPGQVIDVFRAGGTSFGLSETTDEVGVYRIGHLEPGTYFVHYTNQDVWYDGQATGASADPVVVVDEQITSGIDFSVDLTGSISGTVSGRGGPVLPGIRVDLQTGQWTIVQSTSTAADGSYTFTGVDPGGYAVKAHDPSGAYADTWYGDPGDRFDTASGVGMGLSEDVVGKDIAMFAADIGERIDLFPWICLASETECFFGEVEFAAETPFHVVHGWGGETPEETRDTLDPGTRFDLYLDGELLSGEETIEVVDDLTTKHHRYIFPHGLSGTHVLLGEWWFLGEFDADSEVIVTFVDWGTFTDDDGSVFEADIEWMAAEGITKGCNPPANDRFCPDAHVTRGQMAAFLVRALGLTERLDDPFVDDDESIFEADIERLAAAGITKGCNPPSNDRFCPEGKVTRGQMAAFLVRALGYVDNGGGNLFVDDDGSIFEADIDRLGTAGVTKGCNPPTNDRYCPTSNVTRGQMAAFLHRALG